MTLTLVVCIAAPTQDYGMSHRSRFRRFHDSGRCWRRKRLHGVRCRSNWTRRRERSRNWWRSGMSWSRTRRMGLYGGWMRDDWLGMEDTNNIIQQYIRFCSAVLIWNGETPLRYVSLLLENASATGRSFYSMYSGWLDLYLSITIIIIILNRHRPQHNNNSIYKSNNCPSCAVLLLQMAFINSIDARE